MGDGGVHSVKTLDALCGREGYRNVRDSSSIGCRSVGLVDPWQENQYRKGGRSAGNVGYSSVKVAAGCSHADALDKLTIYGRERLGSLRHAARVLGNNLVTRCCCLLTVPHGRRNDRRPSSCLDKDHNVVIVT